MTINKKMQIAIYGENLAAKYLESKGYAVIARNVRTGYQEIDIIASFKEKIIFVEVKTRTTDSYGGADTAISRDKYKSLKRGINNYLITRKIDPEKARLDFIVIDLDVLRNIANVKHFIEIL